jgi:hypothetical protein
MTTTATKANAAQPSTTAADETGPCEPTSDSKLQLPPNRRARVSLVSTLTVPRIMLLYLSDQQNMNICENRSSRKDAPKNKSGLPFIADIKHSG